MLAVSLLGFSAFAFALFNLELSVLDWKIIPLAIFTFFIAPRMSLVMPRSNFSVSFSDSLIFLTFLIFGGKMAIVLASMEVVFSCLFLKERGVKFSVNTILFNFAMTSLSTTVTYVVWLFIPQITGINHFSPETTNLVIMLAILACVQFLSTSVIAGIFYSLKSNISFWQIWKNEGVSSSITQIAGAGLAAIIYKLIAYSNLLVTIICTVVFCAAYFNYRRMLSGMADSMNQAELAEREKAEAEKKRAEEAVKYADELSMLLKIEEDTSKALRQSRQQFQFAALHDSMTNLPNRASFAEILKKIIQENKEKQHSDTYVLFIDLARFKTINDSFGHIIGDKVLMLIAKRFLRSLQSSDKVFRLAGDEFAVILQNLSTVQKAEKVAWKIHQKISHPFALSGNKINVGLNIGVAPCSVDYDATEDVLRDADIAMHFAKENGSGVEIFSEELRSRFVQRAQIESELPFAIERNELALFYQPIISLKDGSLLGFEALLRWFHSKRGFISPAEFIPIAEETGHIIPITTWILKETCRQIAEWQKISYATRNLVMSVNISGKHLSFQSLLIDVEDALEHAKLLPSSLKLEITESAAMQDGEQTVRMLSHLKSLGVMLSIDDFGTGYSSLSNLHQLPFDTLKIDRSFVMNVGEKGENSQILQTIISLAKNLRMKVIAEGIETESQLALLKNLGCDFGQGYLISKPLPKDAMEELLYQKNQWLTKLDTGELVASRKDQTDEKRIPAH